MSFLQYLTHFLPRRNKIIKISVVLGTAKQRELLQFLWKNPGLDYESSYAHFDLGQGTKVWETFTFVNAQTDIEKWLTEIEESSQLHRETFYCWQFLNRKMC